MKNKSNRALRVAFYGMDERGLKTMEMYLSGPCRGVAEVGARNDADVDIINADVPKSAEILEMCQKLNPDRPIILLSLEQLKIPDTLFVKKPIDIDKFLEALNLAKESIRFKQLKAAKQAVLVSSTPAPNIQEPIAENEQSANGAQQEIIKPKAPTQNKSGFISYLGFVTDIDFNDPRQVRQASFDPKNFYLGYVLSALKVAKDKGVNLKLDTGWKLLLILPHTNQVSLEVDDKQLRAFSGIQINREVGRTFGISPLDPNFTIEQTQWVPTDAFLWKMAIWTSKGRFPSVIDINRSIILKHWPNFTCLLITPHAFRIAALLMQGPRPMLNIARVLNIKIEYVFVFISACYAINLVEQVKEQEILSVVSENIAMSKKQGLLSKILKKLSRSN